MAKKAYIGIDGKARKVKKAYIGIQQFEPRELPEGYTQVEYIESSGTQYVDTLYKQTTEKQRVVADLEYTTKIAQTSPFGCQNNSTGTRCIIPYGYTATTVGLFVGSGQNIINNTVALNTRYVYDITANNGSATFVLNGNDSTATYGGATTKDLNYFIFANNVNGNVQQLAAIKLYSIQMYDNNTLVRDYVPCTNQTGVGGLYDLVNSKFYGNSGTGSFAVGTSATSTARKVKKGYIGIGGVARPFMSGGELAYYGTITGLSQSRCYIGATTVGNYALFAGGVPTFYETSVFSSTVDAYDKSFTRSNPTGLQEAVSYTAATTNGNHALFAGGNRKSGVGNYKHASVCVTAYDSSLVRSSATNLTTNLSHMGATMVGNYALFAGGTENNSSAKTTAIAYDKNLTQVIPTTLSSAMARAKATTVGNHAIIAGGSVVNAYDSSLTRTILSSLSTNKYGRGATTVGNYALFAGGTDASNYISNAVHSFNKSLTLTNIDPLTSSRHSVGATTIGDYALFAGGQADASNTGWINNVESYDIDLVHTMQTPLSEDKNNMGATTIGDYALFAGGVGDRSTLRSSVDVYMIS